MYELYDEVELKDGTIAIIIEKHPNNHFIFEIPDSEEFMRSGNASDIKRKVA